MRELDTQQRSDGGKQTEQKHMRRAGKRKMEIMNVKLGEEETEGDTLAVTVEDLFV